MWAPNTHVFKCTNRILVLGEIDSSTMAFQSPTPHLQQSTDYLNMELTQR